MDIVDQMANYSGIGTLLPKRTSSSLYSSLTNCLDNLSDNTLRTVNKSAKVISLILFLVGSILTAIGYTNKAAENDEEMKERNTLYKGIGLTLLLIFGISAIYVFYMRYFVRDF